MFLLRYARPSRNPLKTRVRAVSGKAVDSEEFKYKHPLSEIVIDEIIKNSPEWLNEEDVSWSNLGSFQPLVLCSTIILAGGILYSSLLILAAFPIMIGLLLAKIIGRRRRRKTFTINKEFIYMVTISTVALSLVLVFSTIVGEENDRYMIYIFPYLVISALLVLSFLAEKIRDHSDGKT